MSEQSNNAGLGNVAYVVRSVEGATTIARGNMTNSKIETVDEIHKRIPIKMRVDYDKDQLAYALANALKERDEAQNASLQKEETK